MTSEKPPQRLLRTDLVGLADLAVMHRRGLPLRRVATLCGMRYSPPRPDVSPVSAGRVAAPREPAATAPQPPVALSPPFWRVHDREDPAEDEPGVVEPGWLKGVEPVDSGWFMRCREARAPRRVPLLPRGRLDACLRHLLAESRPVGPLDEPALTHRVADCLPLMPLPRLPRWRWPRQIQVVFDVARPLAPILEDQRWLLRQLERRLGPAMAPVAVVDDGGRWRAFAGPRRLSRHEFPAEGGAVLVLGDLGCLGDDPGRRGFWAVLGQDLRRRGMRSAVLSVCPPARLPPALRRLWRAYYWDRGRGPARPRSKEDRRKRRERLLALLTGAVRVESGLLRAMRCLLPASQADVETELEAWSDDELVAARPLDMLELSVDRRGDLRDLARAEGLPRECAEVVLQSWHAGQTPALEAEEFLNAVGAGLHRGSREVLQALVRCLRQTGKADPRTPLGAWLVRWEGRRRGGDWRDPVCAAVWGCQHVTEDRSGFDRPLPAGLRLRDVAWILRGHGPARQAVVCQRGQSLILVDSEQATDMVARGGCVLARMPYRHAQAKAVRRPGGDEESVSLRVGDREGTRLPVEGEVDIEAVGSCLTLRTVEKPSWAVDCRRSAAGLWVKTGLPVVGSTDVPWPDQASDWGRDGRGVWAELPLSDTVRMRLRWVPPGSFLMGSPDGEQGRFDDEVQHSVTITRGFWLGETPCTQEQWAAVMGGNPSHFKEQGSSRPVEQVSWEDCQGFCERLGRTVPGLDFRLPTEAEWEYACRAGTTSAFNDGSECTRPDGKDLALDRLGWHGEGFGEGETHPVREKQPNTWGLYDMHGNVWEWCEDAAEVQLDPYRVVTDTYTDDAVDPVCRDRAWRVVRGGSCWYLARNCRSASRYAFEPGYRDRYLGFRLASGQPPESSAATGAAAGGADAPRSRDATPAAGTDRGARRRGRGRE